MSDKLDRRTVSSFCLAVCSLFIFGFNLSSENEAGPRLLGFGLAIGFANKLGRGTVSTFLFTISSFVSGDFNRDLEDISGSGTLRMQYDSCAK